MTKQEKRTVEAEDFVRRVLTGAFGQNPSKKQIREVAKKVRETLPKIKEEVEVA